ncbi:MAG TPA: zinc ribbon domain-containing protein [Actinomycetota bacterium]|nr:zinc ribbon domain-containing protein [Actinomycetota bacterium]
MPLRCGSCGATRSNDDRFCSRCGAPAQAPGPRACPECGSPAESTDRFCRICGAAFLTSSPQAAAPAGGNGFEDILAGWDLDLPSFAADAEEAPTGGVTTAPPQAAAETAVLERPQPMDRPLVKEEDEEENQSSPELPVGKARAAGGFPWGATIALLGAVTVIVSAILPWDAAGAILPRDIPAAFLLGSPAGGPNLGLVLLGVGTVGALVALLTMAIPATSILRRLIGVLTFAIPLAVIVRGLGIGALIRPDQIVGALGVGAYAAAAGGIVQVVAGRWWLRRR